MNLVESLYVKDGAIRHCSYHKARLAENGILLREQDLLDLFYQTEPNPIPYSAYKMRIVYDSQKILTTSASLYNRRNIQKLTIQEIPSSFSYKKKWLDRSAFDELTKGLSSQEELVLVQSDLVTDTTFSNLCFFDKEQQKWYTPCSYLLNGTMRRYCIDQKLCEERAIGKGDIAHYSHVSLINAMNLLGEIILPISAINTSY